MTEAELKQRFADTKFVVEATSDEHQFLWERWSQDALFKPKEPGFNRLSIEQMNPGWFETIGHVAGRPICIDLRWDRINGVLVMFWEVTSELADHKMAREWLEQRCSPAWDAAWDGDTRLAYTNASNFHHAVHAIDAMGGKPVPTDSADLHIAADLCEDRGFELASKLLRQAEVRC